MRIPAGFALFLVGWCVAFDGPHPDFGGTPVVVGVIVCLLGGLQIARGIADLGRSSR